MIERIHPCILEGPVRLLAVPALPDRGGALLHGIEPGRVLLAVEQEVGLVEVPVTGEHLAQVRRAEESRGQMLPLTNVLGQPPGGGRPQLLRQQVELESDRVGRLRVLAHAPGGGDVLADERFLDP